MIMKKTGLIIAAAAAAIMLSGCATGARNVPENMPVCETPCMPPCNTCKGMSACKEVGMNKCKQTCPPKHHKKRHRRCRAENSQPQAQMNT